MKYFLLALIFIGPMLLEAQLRSDNFDTYSEGLIDPQWDPTVWKSGQSNASNAIITTEQVFSGANAVLLKERNGVTSSLTGILGPLSEGIHKISFRQYIPGANGAYFSIVDDWAANAWIYFGDTTFTEVPFKGGNSEASLVPKHDQWVDIEFIFDFHHSQAQFFYDKALILTWPINVFGIDEIWGINFYSGCRGASCASLAYYDNVVVKEVPIPDYDIALINAQSAIEYGHIPIGQVEPLNFKIEYSNIGSRTITEIEAVARVYDESNTLIHTELLGVKDSLAAGASASFSLQSTFSPTLIGSYSVEYSLSIAESDEFLANNENKDFKFNVTEDTYARDDGHFFSGHSCSSFVGLLNMSGVVYELKEESSISSIDVFHWGGTFGDLLSGHIYSLDEDGKPDKLLYSTERFGVNFGSPTIKKYTIHFDTLVQLPPANYFFAVKKRGSIAVSRGAFVPNTVWCSLDEGDTWHLPNVDDGFFVYGIRPVVESVNPTEAPMTIEKFSLSPNPAEQATTIHIKVSEAKDLLLDVFNIHGQKIKNIKKSQVNGDWQYPLDLSGLANGIYLVRLTMDNQVFNRKLILSH